MLPKARLEEVLKRHHQDEMEHEKDEEVEEDMEPADEEE